MIFALLLGAAAAQALSADERQAEWEEALAAAEKEGQVAYSGCGTYGFLGEFQKKYPKIKVNVVSARCGEIVARIMSERRAGKYLSDVARLGLTSAHTLYRAGAFQSIRSAFILPEVRDESKWWQGRHHYSDAEGRYLFIPVGSVYSRFASYNTGLVNAADFKSYWELLNPKWKGKIIATDPRTGEGRNGSRFLYYHPALGPQYLRRLFGEMDVTLSRDYRQATDWLAQKRFSLFLFGQSDDILNARAQGLPVDILDAGAWKEGAGLDAMSGAYALLDRPAHPHAAKVLINWLLSREGQTALQKDRESAGVYDSLRVDIPKSDVQPMMRRRPGFKYVVMWTPEWMDMEPVAKLLGEALGEAGKK